MDIKNEECGKIIDALLRELVITKLALDEARRKLDINEKRLKSQFYIKKENSNNVYKPSAVNPIISESISYFFGGILK